MQVSEEPDGTLVLTYDSTRWSTFLFVLAAAMLAAIAWEYFAGRRESERIIGLFGGAATCLLAGVVFLEQARVTVSRATRTIAWARRWAFQRRHGSLSFDQVDAVLPERPIGDEGVPSRRIVLLTKDGQSIPLTKGYRPDGDETILKASERIRALLGHDASASTRDSVRALVATGRVVDAIKLLRQEEGLSLTEAKQRVDAMKSRP